MRRSLPRQSGHIALQTEARGYRDTQERGQYDFRLGFEYMGREAMLHVLPHKVGHSLEYLET